MLTSTTLIGASGLVGSRLLAALGASAVPMNVWSRQPLVLPASARPRVAAEPPPAGDPFWEAQVTFVALGTTIAKAGSQEAFRAVDRDLVCTCAQRARQAGCTTLALVSAAGASPTSRIFYNRVKGETEQALLQMGFPHVVLARPSLLLGERQEVRLGERLFQRLLGPVRGLLPRGVRPVRAEEVARSMLHAVQDRSIEDVTILENARLLEGF